ncbi:Transposase, Mutator family [Gaiella occulta]|uniref:Mutator family transposase n=1 Tax=Gaiella occulta TaxID=1002870 RepID=A0A7M2YUN9_9ACTN|nr:IS256 family transposase [Gaiella occulta]RDI73187.1 Transposase, Mutator family [Gaiella occulta]
MKKETVALVPAEVVLPPRVQEALGQLVGAAKEGLLALSVGVGLGVLAELMEEEVVDVVGAKGRHDAERTAVRHGHESGEVTLGGRRVGVERPRVRSADGRAEMRLQTYVYFADRDPLSRSVLERMLAGVSTRRYRRTQEPVGSEVEQAARSTSRSAVSRTFIERTRRSLGELMSRRLDDVRLAVMMIDGLELQGRTNVVALGISTEGVKIPLGLWEGSSENATVATALLSDLVERGLDPEQGILFVIDGAKALRKAVRNVFGDAPVQRCLRHKERNVTEHLPERDRPNVQQRLRRAWAQDDHARALDQLRRLAGELDHVHPGAAGSLREGMEETLTLTRLGVSGSLKRTLSSTNPCESMIEIVRRTQRNVKRWSSGEMALRWTAAGMLEAERQFRKIIGYRDLATLLVAIEHDHDRRRHSLDAARTSTKETAIVAAV